ncbi:MAG TPA: tRNA-dihydrouridine synthase [Alcanivoracaceae bacterium]|nr:tRNA-dihydrouridine synthase [Alcanivoracaceae bacterium]
MQKVSSSHSAGTAPLYEGGKALVLAPMEGVADYWLRQILTQVGGYDWCVTEFVRVSGRLLPPSVFYRWCPELKQQAKTVSGTPVHVQLLGSDASCMADNAARAVELGAPAIDLNFGCPAKTVNRHSGGAVILDEPELLHAIVAAVRKAVPAHIPVSAKMRLGNADKGKALDNALAAAEANASWLTVHARTKTEGYRPPAYWSLLAPLAERIDIPLIANGEVWAPSDATRCAAESNTPHLMVGRGAVTNPFLAQEIRGANATHWEAVFPLLLQYCETLLGTGLPRQEAGRIKQWLNYLRRQWPVAENIYHELKRERESATMLAWLHAFKETAVQA